MRRRLWWLFAAEAVVLFSVSLAVGLQVGLLNLLQFAGLTVEGRWGLCAAVPPLGFSAAALVCFAFGIARQSSSLLTLVAVWEVASMVILGVLGVTGMLEAAKAPWERASLWGWSLARRQMGAVALGLLLLCSLLLLAKMAVLTAVLRARTAFRSRTGPKPFRASLEGAGKALDKALFNASMKEAFGGLSREGKLTVSTTSLSPLRSGSPMPLRASLPQPLNLYYFDEHCWAERF